MPSYITGVSELLGSECAQIPKGVLLGENINNGSRIVGMCRQLTAPPGGRILNIGDCEATHIGAGFGMMLNGVNSVLFAKQHDFMLLGLDHYVNTYNFIRCSRDPRTLGAFTIIAVICDQGYQGPQSSFNSVGDMCSLARIPGFMLTNAQDTPRILHGELSRPGFRVIALSQRLFGTEFLDPGFVWAAPDHSTFQYSAGEDLTIVCFNFSLSYGYALQERLRKDRRTVSLFSANNVFPTDYERIIRSVGETGRLVVLDDSKSTNLAGHRLLHEAGCRYPHAQRVMLERGVNVDFGVTDDAFVVDHDGIVSQVFARRAA